MKRIAASVGLVALGASTVTTFAAADDSTMVNGKPWSVSATLRGFYDDNINSVPDGSPDKEHSWGFSVEPGIAVNFPMETTQIKASYQFTGIWYDKEPGANFPAVSTGHWDEVHQFNGELDHQFSDRYQVSVLDSFVVGQEPDVLAATTVITSPQRLSGDNYRNFGTIHFTAVLTPLISLDAGYANQYWSYDDHGASVFGGPPYVVGRVVGGGTAFLPGASTAGLLDRIENTPSLEVRFHALPQTYFSLGFIYDDIDYNAGEPIAVDPILGKVVSSDYRNSRSYIGYAGVNHNFNSQLTATAQVGAQSYDAYNDPAVSSDVTPWANASITYTYQPQSTATVGFTYMRSASDLAGAIVTTNGVANLTTDATYATLFLTVHHAITPDLVASVTGTYQHAEYNNGPFNSDTEDLYLIGLDLSYKFNPFLSVDAGYNFNDLDSPSSIGRGYTRNIAYVGVTGTY